MDVALHIFRSTDLRLFDNRALQNAFLSAAKKTQTAAQQQRPVLCVVCVDQQKNFRRKWMQISGGGHLRRRFHRECVEDLGRNLGRFLPPAAGGGAQQGADSGGLYVFFGDAVQLCSRLLPGGGEGGIALTGSAVNLADRAGAAPPMDVDSDTNNEGRPLAVREVFVSREYGSYEWKEEEKLAKLCASNNAPLRISDDATLLDVDLVTQKLGHKLGSGGNAFGNFPDQFTSFRGLVERQLSSDEASWKFRKVPGGNDQHVVKGKYPAGRAFCEVFSAGVADRVFALRGSGSFLAGGGAGGGGGADAPLLALAPAGAACAVVKLTGESAGSSAPAGGSIDGLFAHFGSAAATAAFDALVDEAVSEDEALLGKGAAGAKRAAVFPGGETAAAGRLRKFVWGAGGQRNTPLATYKDTRNRSLGDTYSSKLSMYLSLGCVSARSVCHAVAAFEEAVVRNESTYWLIFELLWRDYMKFAFLKHGDTFFQLSGIQRNPKWVPAASGAGVSKTHRNAGKGGRSVLNGNRNELAAFIRGETGFPYVDAHMKELTATGFMGNRGRQNIASFLVFNLNMDWRVGCEVFEHFLLDHDCLSNAGNWQTIAGVGFQQRENRFNIVKQSLQYEKSGEFIKHWIPALRALPASVVHVPWEWSGAGDVPDVYRNPLRPRNTFFYESRGGGGGGSGGASGGGRGAPAQEYWGEGWQEGGNIKIPSYTPEAREGGSADGKRSAKKRKWAKGGN